MEPPVSLDAESIRDEKVKLLKAIQPLALGSGGDVARAQYAAGMMAVGGERLLCGGRPSNPQVATVDLRGRFALDTLALARACRLSLPPIMPAAYCARATSPPDPSASG